MSFTEPRVYMKRWAMLVMFIALSASNGAQWIMYSVIAQIISDFYGVSFTAVDCTSMIYMATYILLFIPAATNFEVAIKFSLKSKQLTHSDRFLRSLMDVIGFLESIRYLLDKYGLRVSLLLGAIGNASGAWVRMLSARPDGFWVTFVGQTIVGASQMFTLGIPPRLAAVWFGSNEVSTACAAGVFGNQLGIAIGFLVPPLLVKNGTREEVASDLTGMFLYSAVLNSAILLLIVCFFSARPRSPPSMAQIASQEEKALGSNFWQSLVQLMTSKDFVLLFITYGINTGVFYAVSTLLAQMVLPFYPTESVAIGQIGVVMVVAGMIGSVVGGILLDKFKKFKLTTIMAYLFAFLGMVLFTFTLDLGSIVVVFVNAFLLGFFMTGYLPIGFEFAAEITFPTSEGTTSGLLNASAQIFGISLTFAMGAVLHGVSTFVCNAIMSLFLFAGMCLTGYLKPKPNVSYMNAINS
ncbi:unnamed protein product [Nippostrongylus brasiliensis]|uniref:Uncharacterized MFS-type transporter (inferred by orthology to a C. elegans protein) n=1 Tax=Nippostrongylus brasiliensis TaxID=27835 RepID=A0A0N4YCN8_NIPBR|nr:unnamed protein product [Nippostrongylus brasiliensis]